jgi:opacity protein-like surface antigen
MNKALTGWMSLGAVLAVAAPCAMAQTPAPLEDELWQYEVGPFIWATGMSGYIRPSQRAPLAHFNNSFSDLRLNAGGFGMEAGRGRWGVLASVTSIGQSQDSDPLQSGSNAKTMPDGSYTVLDLAAAYRLSYDPDTHFDLVAGLRYSSLDMDVTQPPYVAPTSCVKCSHNEHWTDGIAGFKVEHRMGPNWMINAYADIGGGASKTTWQALLGASWRLDDGVYAKFGYRVLSVDYDIDRLLYNLKTSGLYAGVTMRF